MVMFYLGGEAHALAGWPITNVTSVTIYPGTICTVTVPAVEVYYPSALHYMNTIASTVSHTVEVGGIDISTDILAFHIKLYDVLLSGALVDITGGGTVDYEYTTGTSTITTITTTFVPNDTITECMIARRAVFYYAFGAAGVTPAFVPACTWQTDYYQLGTVTASDTVTIKTVIRRSKWAETESTIWEYTILFGGSRPMSVDGLH